MRPDSVGAELGQAGRAHEVLVGVVLADALQVRRLGLAGRAARSADVTMNAPPASEIRQQSSMPQRIGDRLGVQHLLERDRRLHMRVGMQQRVRARVHRHVRQLLARRAVLVHVALRDHRVVARDRAAVGLLEVRVPHAPAARRPRRRGSGRSRGSRRRRRGPSRPGPATIASRRVLEHDAGARAAADHRGVEARLAAPGIRTATEPSMKYGSVNE